MTRIELRQTTKPISWSKAGLTQTSSTVADLIEALKQMPADALVMTEGCDCTGNAVAVSVDEDGDVMIHRD